MRKIATLTLVLSGALLGGCIFSPMGSARVVKRDQYGGTIALEGDRAKATEQAQAAMSEHCRGPFQIVEEGEHVIGQDTQGGSENYVANDGTVVENRGATTRNATEWRITYQCGGGAPAPAPMPVDPNAPPPVDPNAAPPPPSF